MVILMIMALLLLGIAMALAIVLCQEEANHDRFEYHTSTYKIQIEGRMPATIPQRGNLLDVFVSRAFRVVVMDCDRIRGIDVSQANKS